MRSSIGSYGAMAITGTNVNAADTKSAEETSKEETILVKEQLGNDYTQSVGYNALATKDKKEFGVCLSNGVVYSIDNSDGEITDIYIGTGSNEYNVVFTRNKDNKQSIVGVDGNFYGKLDGFYDQVGITNNDSQEYGGSYYYVDGTTLFVCRADGTLVNKIENFNENVMYMTLVGNNIGIGTMNGRIFIGADGKENKNFEIGNLSTFFFDDYYIRKENSVVNPETQYVDYTYTYYDRDLKEITEEEARELDKLPAYKNTLKSDEIGFDYEAVQLTLPDGFSTYGNYTIGDAKLVAGNKGINMLDGYYSDYQYAIFNTDGTYFLKNIVSDYPSGNVFIVNDNGTYRFIKVYEKKAVAAAVVADKSGDLTTSVKIETDKSDQIEIAASKNVIPVGSKFTIKKITTGKEYDSTKQILNEVSTKFIILNIDLLDSENVKIQPNGTVEITMEIPANYDPDKVAVYTVSEGKYSKADSKVVDGKLIILAKHFSTYVISENKKIVNESKAPIVSEIDKKDEATDTSDFNTKWLFVLAAVFAILGSVVYIKKSKTNE